MLAAVVSVVKILVVVPAIVVRVIALAVVDITHGGGLTRWEHCRSNTMCWLLHSAIGPWQQRTLFSAGATHGFTHPASV